MVLDLVDILLLLLLPPSMVFLCTVAWSYGNDILLFNEMEKTEKLQEEILDLHLKIKELNSDDS